MSAACSLDSIPWGALSPVRFDHITLGPHVHPQTNVFLRSLRCGAFSWALGGVLVEVALRDDGRWCILGLEIYTLLASNIEILLPSTWTLGGCKMYLPPPRDRKVPLGRRSSEGPKMPLQEPKQPKTKPQGGMCRRSHDVARFVTQCRLWSASHW